jgi:hypothetical protein
MLSGQTNDRYLCCGTFCTAKRIQVSKYLMKADTAGPPLSFTSGGGQSSTGQPEQGREVKLVMEASSTIGNFSSMAQSVRSKIAT